MMTRKVFNDLKNDCRNYDPFTMYIDSYRQHESADRANARIVEHFSKTVAEYTGEDKEYSILYDCENCSGEELEVALLTYLNELGIEVEERHIWSEEEIAHLIQTNNRVLLNTFKKLNSFAVDNKFIANEDRAFLRSVASFYYKNDAITNNQAAAIRKILAKYTTELTALANKLD